MDWRNTDGQFILCCCVIPHLFHIVPGGIYKRQAGASYNPYVYSYINEICDHTFHKESGWAHAGLISLDVPHMPEKYRNSVIFGSIHGCSIKQNILKPNGSTYTATRGDDFLQSGDKNFRPINLRWGPLGDIYVIDWHDQNPCHQAAADSWDYEHGRIYRIQLKGTKPKKAEDLGKKTMSQLQKLTGNADPYISRTALRLLSERPDHSLSKGDGEVGKNPFVEFAGIEARGFPQAGYGLQEEFYNNRPNQRGFAVRIVAERYPKIEYWLGLFTKLAAKESDPFVRRELASTAIRFADIFEVRPLVHALLKHREDARDPVIPHLLWIAYEKILAKGLREPPGTKTSAVDAEFYWLALDAPDNALVREHIVPKVMRRLVATGKAEDLKRCIDFIVKVKDAPSREKALEGLVVALAGQTVTAPESWSNLQSELVASGDARLVALANKLAVSFRDPAAIKRAFETATDLKRPVEARVEAVRQIALFKEKGSETLLLAMVKGDPVAAVRTEAARSLAAFDQSFIPLSLLGDWPKFSKELRAEVVNTLSTRKEWARDLLKAMAAKTIDRTDATDNVILRIQAFNDRDLNKLIETAWGRTRPTPADLNALIDKTRASLYAAPASFERGRKVFETNCAKCHKFEGKGAEVGPPLEGAARDIEYILVNVLDPNRVVGAPYFVRTARLLNDTVFQGVLAEEDDKTITLKLENGVLKKIKKEDLNGPVQVSEKSMMPEGLGYNMTAQDFRDLVRYLMAHPFIADATVNGEKLVVGAPDG